MKHRKTFLHQLTRSFVTISEFITPYNYCVPLAINLCCQSVCFFGSRIAIAPFVQTTLLRVSLGFSSTLLSHWKHPWENTKQLSVQEQYFYQASQSLLGEVVLASLFFDIEMWTFNEFRSVRKMTLTKLGIEDCFHISTLKRLPQLVIL